jgi:hypothetical protein
MSVLQEPTKEDFAIVERVLAWLASYSPEGYVKVEHFVADGDYCQDYMVLTYGRVGAGNRLADAIKFFTLKG